MCVCIDERFKAGRMQAKFLAQTPHMTNIFVTLVNPRETQEARLRIMSPGRKCENNLLPRVLRRR